MKPSYDSSLLVTSAWRLSAIACACLLAACGGSGGTSTAAIGITGTAATGAALAKASIEARCANGTSGTTTSADDGVYTVQVTGGALPCMLKAVGIDSAGNAVTLHSVADTGATTANITPVTELVVAAAYKDGDTAKAFSEFAATTATQTALSGNPLTNAKAIVKEAVKTAAATADFSTIDPLTAKFTAKTGTVNGDSTDQKIDALMTALKTNATTATNSAVITSLATAVAKATKENPTDTTAATNAAKTAAGTVVSKPFDVASCPAARAVKYRIVGLGGGHGLTGVPTVSSSNSNQFITTSTWNDGTTENDTLTFDTATTCKFTLTTGSGSLTGAFASSGAFVIQDPGSTTSQAGIGIGFPEQTIPLSELAGVWNGLEYSRDGSAKPWQNLQSVVTIDSVGKVTGMKDCTGSTAATNSCTESADAKPSFTVNSSGGFDISGSGGGRAFAFRAPSGDLMMVVSIPSANGGGMIIAGKHTDLQQNLKAGDVSNTHWVLAGGSTTLSTSFTSAKFTVSEVTSYSTSRIRNLLNGAADGATYTEVLNAPRSGLRYRPLVTYTPTGKTTTSTWNAAVQMPIKGADLIVGISPGETGQTPFMAITVKP